MVVPRDAGRVHGAFGHGRHRGLSAFRKNFKEGARDRVFADEQLLDYDLLLRRPAERDMEYAVLRLAMRSVVFLVAFALCVSHLVRKRDFIDAVFRSPDEERKSFSGRNDVLFLRVLNIVPMVVAVATAEYLPHTGYGAIVERG